MRKYCVAATALGLVLLATGCGGGSSSSKTSAPPATTLTVAPASATVALGKSVAFAVKGTSPPPVTWAVNGVTGGNSTTGTISASGVYTAPSTFPSSNKMTITATAKSNSSSRGQASATVVYPNDNTQAQTSPIKLGTSGGNNNDLSGNVCCSGTLGALVSRGGSFYILSNNHVLDKSDTGTVGDPIGQPGLVDNNCSGGAVVAHLSQSAPLQTSNVDAAIAKIVSGAVDTNGTILDLGAAGSTSIAAAPPSATVADPATVMSNNEGVAKSGRSSGLTCSNLGSFNTSVSVDYDKSCGGAKAFTVIFDNQLVINGGTFSSGGDSGSLVVTSDTARPVGLLYAGSDTNTVANPISAVLNALKDSTTHEAPVVVGGGDHSVSCVPTEVLQSAQASAGPASAIAREELDRATGVKERFAQTLMSDPALRGVGVGASVDAPGKAAIVLYVSGTPLKPVPAQIEGVRTKVVYTSPFGARSAQTGERVFPITSEEIGRGVAAKELHSRELLAQPGIIGVGVGRSDDAPGESAVVVYVEKGKAHAAVPVTIDGVRTKLVETQRFKALGWGHEKARPACRLKKQR